MDHLIRDIQYALRGLRRAPGFTLVAVMTLALGIGVNSTIFSIVNAVLLRPLPVQHPEELVDVYGHASNSATHDTSSWLDYQDLRAQSKTLDGLAAYSSFFANLALSGRSELVVGELVSDNYFDVLGVQPRLGRAFTAEEFASEGAAPVAILSHEFWATRFGQRPDIVGQSMRLNGIAYQVVGVMPASFGGMFPAVTAQMWLPIAMVEQVEPLGNQRSSPSATGDTRLTRRGQRWLWLRGRMASGSEVASVQAELEGIMARLATEYPESNELETLTVLATDSVHINPDFDSAIVPAGLLLLGIVALVMLVACANLANMLLARGATRARELAIRVALGAGRSRLLRQLLTESLVLALLGGAAGLILAFWLVGLLGSYQPPLPIDLSADFSLDWRVLVFTLVAASVTGIAFGLLPALRASRPDLVPALKDSDAPDAGGRRRLNLRDALVVLQVAVSIVLLVSGALLVRSLTAAGQADLGYDIDHLAFFGLPLEMSGYDGAQSASLFDTAKLRLQALPGIEAVTNTSRVPLSLNNNGFGVFIDGHQTSASDRPYIVDGAYVDADYFDTLGLRILQGRGIDSGDVAERRKVAVVTQTMADRYWPAENPIGQQFRTSWEGTPVQIVGVVADYKVDSPGESPKPYIHLPRSRTSTYGNLLVRTTGPAAAATDPIIRELLALDPDLVFLDSGPVRKLAAVRLLPVSVGAWLIGAFGLLALGLAAVGLYGVIGYAVTRRTHEIGIRMALGAERRIVLRLVLQQGMGLVLIGGVLGAGLAALLGRLLSSVLFVSSLDPLSFAAAFLVLAAVAAIANWVPARRAATVDPMIALRSS